MENRALVIRTTGDQTPAGPVTIKLMGNQKMAGAIYDGIAKNVIAVNEKELAALRAELEKLRAREGVKKHREDRDWHIVQLDLERKYGTKPHGELYGKVLVAWVLTLLFAQECFKRLGIWIREGRR